MMRPAARVALHMADATSYRPPSPRRRLPPLWKGWMTLAGLALASTGLAVIIAYVLRRML